jgi:hypothetical protein
MKKHIARIFVVAMLWNGQALCQSAITASDTELSREMENPVTRRITLPTPSTWHCGPAALIRPSQPIDHGCCPTMVPATLRAIWPNGSTTAISNTFAARPIIRSPRAKSSAGIRPSRTASCFRSSCPIAATAWNRKESGSLDLGSAETPWPRWRPPTGPPHRTLVRRQSLTASALRRRCIGPQQAFVFQLRPERRRNRVTECGNVLPHVFGR